MKKPKTKLERAKERFWYRFAQSIACGASWLNSGKGSVRAGDKEQRAFRRQLNNLIRLARQEKTCSE